MSESYVDTIARLSKENEQLKKDNKIAADLLCQWVEHCNKPFLVKNIKFPKNETETR
jgi:hypothetical protein